MMSRMLLSSSSSSCVLVILLCLTQECSGRHVSSIDDHVMDAKVNLQSHSSIKGLGSDPFITGYDDLDLKMTAKGKDQAKTIDEDHNKQTDCGSKNKNGMIKDQKVKKFKEFDHRHRHQHHMKSVTFRVPMKHRRIHPQPGFNLDYSPPKTHPPSHN